MGTRVRGGDDFADEVIADRMTKESADVAQLVEQLIRNQQVNGSSPFVGSITSIAQGSVAASGSRSDRFFQNMVGMACGVRSFQSQSSIA